MWARQKSYFGNGATSGTRSGLRLLKFWKSIASPLRPSDLVDSDGSLSSVRSWIAHSIKSYVTDFTKPSSSRITCSSRAYFFPKRSPGNLSALLCETHLTISVNLFACTILLTMWMMKLGLLSLSAGCPTTVPMIEAFLDQTTFRPPC